MPSVFISYSHDSGHHVDRVLALADQLRADAIDVRLDQYEPHPPAGWPAWMQQQVATTDFVVLVCTPTFRRRFDREEAEGAGLGATWEGMLAQQLLYEAGARNHRLLPVVFEDADPTKDIPLSLRAFTHYRLVAGYDELLRRITNQPRRSAPPLGQPRTLPPDPRPSLFGAGISVDNRNASIGQVVNVTGNATFGATMITMPTPAAPPVPAPASALAPSPAPSPAPVDTILLFTANAVDPARRLELEEELRAILDALKRSRTRDRFTARISPSVTFTTVIHDVDDHTPAIVHFGGHGHHHGELILRGDEDGSERRIAPEHVATLLASLHTPPTLVVFAVCYSEALAAAAAKHVPYAIGFRGEVQDRMLPRFSAALYERLAARPALDVPHAFGLAKLAVTADGFATAEQACLFERPVAR